MMQLTFAPEKLVLFARRIAVVVVCGCLVSAFPHSVLAAPDTDVGRVSPVFTPLPIAGLRPVAQSWPATATPSILPLSGPWRFRLTRGQTIDGVYVSTPDLARIITASSTSGGSGYWSGPPSNAFDDDIGTHWSPATGASLPQWICVDLGRAQSVAGVRLFWDKTGLLQRYRVEGSLTGAAWSTLSDQTSGSAPYAGGGRITFARPTRARYVRLLITGVAEQPAASGKTDSQPPQVQVAEFRVVTASSGGEKLWLPQESEDAFQSPGYAVSRWDQVTLPANWELAGYSRPTYNDYDDAAGEYRRSVFVPSSFAGKRVAWRFDGVFDGADIYVNGVKAGYHESGYTAFDVDLTGLIRPGQINTLAVRACKRTSSIDCDTGDFEALGGIYRDSFLYAVPPAHFSDLTATTQLASGRSRAILDLALPVSGAAPRGWAATAVLYDAAGRRAAPAAIASVRGDLASIAMPVARPLLWSAETPALYTAVVSLRDPDGRTVETVQQKIGFRQIDIAPGQVLRWNGVPIKLAGVCRHEIWPTRGAALNDTIWRRDITLLKLANVNAIRTSHYNHASRFLDLCDQSGFYILDEVPYCWLNEKTYDLGYRPAMIQRARETYARDKNRPSVLAWSCGNENPPGSNTAAVAEFMHRHDPTRPAYSSQQSPPFPGQSFYDRHYPKPSDVAPLARQAQRTAPVIFTEQPHMFSAAANLAYDPGLHDFWATPLQRSWTAIEAEPDIAGSFVWEWQNQPIVSAWSDKTASHRGKPTVWFENDKGVVDGYRNPKPEWWAVKMVYSPVQIADRTIARGKDGAARVTVSNRFSFTNLDQLACRWTAMRGSSSLGSGALPLQCPPLSKTVLHLPVPLAATGMRVEFRRKHSEAGVSAGDLVYAADLRVAGAPLPTPPGSGIAGGALSVQDAGGSVTVSNARVSARFDDTTGDLVDWTLDGRKIVEAGPKMYLGEAHGVVNQFGQDTSNYIGAGTAIRYAAPRIATAADPAGVRVTVTRAVLDAQNQPVGTLTTLCLVRPDASLAVNWTIDSWTGADAHAWEIGMTVQTPPGSTRMSWLRDAQLAYYPDHAAGAAQGACTVGDLSSRGSKRGLRWMTVADASGHGVALASDSADPLIGRLQPHQGAPTTLYATRDEAVDAELSTPWVADSDVTLRKGETISGGFILTAF